MFTMGLPGAESENIREVLERALTAAGLHVTKGALLWTAYREYEMAMLAGLQVLYHKQLKYAKEIIYACFEDWINITKNKFLFSLIVASPW